MGAGADWQDKLAVAELVQTERAARDQGQWARLAACYHPDSIVSISWIETTGPEFVEASKRAFATGIRHLHQMAPTLVTLNGDRALAESGCAILLPGAVGDVAVTVTSHARLHVRAERRDGRWGIVKLAPVYFMDSVAADVPGEIPRFEADVLESYRPSYRYLSYVLVESGKTPRPDLAGADRPHLIEVMMAAEQAWLEGA